jgi:hypothetical protein
MRHRVLSMSRQIALITDQLVTNSETTLDSHAPAITIGKRIKSWISNQKPSQKIDLQCKRESTRPRLGIVNTELLNTLQNHYSSSIDESLTLKSIHNATTRSFESIPNRRAGIYIPSKSPKETSIMAEQVSAINKADAFKVNLPEDT